MIYLLINYIFYLKYILFYLVNDLIKLEGACTHICLRQMCQWAPMTSHEDEKNEDTYAHICQRLMCLLALEGAHVEPF